MYLAYISQPHGCDYTIGCGHLLITLEAAEYDAAVAELRDRVRTYQGDEELESAILLHVTEETAMPVASWYQEQKKEQEQERQKKRDDADRELYEQLRKRFS